MEVLFPGTHVARNCREELASYVKRGLCSCGRFRLQNGPRKGTRKGSNAATPKRANASKRGRLRKQWRKGGAEGVFASLGLKQNKKHSSLVGSPAILDLCFTSALPGVPGSACFGPKHLLVTERSCYAPLSHCRQRFMQEPGVESGP